MVSKSDVVAAETAAYMAERHVLCWMNQSLRRFVLVPTARPRHARDTCR